MGRFLELIIFGTITTGIKQIWENLKMELSNSIIGKICADTKFRYGGNYFIYNVPYNYGK